MKTFSIRANIKGLYLTVEGLESAMLNGTLLLDEKGTLYLKKVIRDLNNQIGCIEDEVNELRPLLKTLSQ